MNVKIQGGGNGTYANTGSCVAVTNYLQHEDLERMKKGEEVQPFFNQFRDYVSAREVRLYPKIFKKSECYKEHVAIVTLPYYSAKEVGLNMCICF